jgi:hypothetical protein
MQISVGDWHSQNVYWNLTNPFAVDQWANFDVLLPVMFYKYQRVNNTAPQNYSLQLNNVFFLIGYEFLARIGEWVVKLITSYYTLL